METNNANEPTTIDVLRYVLEHYGLDAPEMPLEVVQRELAELIHIMELYQ